MKGHRRKELPFGCSVWRVALVATVCLVSLYMGFMASAILVGTDPGPNPTTPQVDGDLRGSLKQRVRDLQSEVNRLKAEAQAGEAPPCPSANPLEPCECEGKETPKCSVAPVAGSTPGKGEVVTAVAAGEAAAAPKQVVALGPYETGEFRRKGPFARVAPGGNGAGKKARADADVVIATAAGAWGAHTPDEWFKPTSPYPKRCPVTCLRTSDTSMVNTADVVQYFGPGASTAALPPKKPGQLYAITGQESAGYYATLSGLDPGYDKVDITQTYQTAVRNRRRKSVQWGPGGEAGERERWYRHKGEDVWAIPAGYWSNYEYGSFAHRRREMYNKKGLAVWMHNNCNAQSKREDVVAALMELMPIDSPGRCLHNRDMSDGSNNKKPTEVVAGYKFYLSFENVFGDPDWVSSTYFRVLDAGSVPVYLGAPNIDKFSPQAGYVIKAYDFESPQALVDYLMYLDANDDEYYKLLRWKEEGPSAEFTQFMELADYHSDCRVCTVVADAKYYDSLDQETKVRVDAFMARYHRWQNLNARLDAELDDGTGDVLEGLVRKVTPPTGWTSALQAAKSWSKGAGRFPPGFTQSDAGAWKQYRANLQKQGQPLPDWMENLP